MCRRRRVFYSCLHEDHDVTPPRAILYCSFAVPSEGGSSGRNVRPCSSPHMLPFTDKTDLFAGIVRSIPCEVCAGLPDIIDTDTPISQSPWTIPPMVTAEAAGSGPRAASNGSSEVASRRDSTIDTLIAGLEDDARLQEELDAFDFAWDGDNGHLSQPAGSENGSNSITNPTDNGQSPSTPGSGDGSFYFDEETTLNEETQSAGELQDFQLYDGEEEFADELSEIGSDKGKGPSTT